MIAARKVENDTETVNGGWLVIIFIKEKVRTPVNLPGNTLKTNKREYFFIQMLGKHLSGMTFCSRSCLGASDGPDVLLMFPFSPVSCDSIIRLQNSLA